MLQLEFIRPDAVDPDPDELRAALLTIAGRCDVKETKLLMAELGIEVAS